MTTPQVNKQPNPNPPAQNAEKPPRALNQDQAANKIKGLNLKRPLQSNTGQGEAEQAKAPKKQPTKTQPQAKAKKPPAEESQEGYTEGEGEGQDATGGENPDLLDTETQDAQGEDEQETPDDTEAEADEDGQEAAEDLHTVIVDGDELQVSYEELIAGYQKNASFLKKSNQLAQDKKSFEAEKEAFKDVPEKKKHYEESAKRFADNAILVGAALQKRFLPQPPKPELLQTDPAAFYQQKEAHAEGLQFMHGLQIELQNIKSAAEKDLQDQIQAGRKELYKQMPKLADPKTGAAARAKLTEYAMKHGFTEDQIRREASPVLFMWAEKARLWDEFQERKTKLTQSKTHEKVAKRTNAVPTAKATQARQKNNALEAHKASGTVQSAGEALKNVKLQRIQ